MAKEYIERDTILSKLGRMINYCETERMRRELTVLFQVGDAVMDCPAADVVEVVRCKDCKYYDDDPFDDDGGCMCMCWNDWLPTNPNDFCIHGERKEQ